MGFLEEHMPLLRGRPISVKAKVMSDCGLSWDNQATTNADQKSSLGTWVGMTF